VTTTRVAGLLAGRDFRRLWIGETTSLLGSSVASVALPLVAVVTLQASTFTVAVLTATAWLPWLLLGLPAGAWVDRLPQRPVMLVADAVSFTVFVSVPITAWFGVLTVAQLLAAAFLGGCAKVFFGTAYRSYLPSLVDSERLPGANAWLQGSESTADVVGPGIAGLIAQAFGAVSGVLADALSFVVSALCLRSLSTSGARRGVGPRRRLRSEMADGLRFVFGDPYLRVLACFSATSNIALAGLSAIAVVFLVRDVGVSPGAAGITLALGQIGGVAAAMVSGRLARRFGTARTMVLSEVLAAPLLGLLGLTRSGAGLVFFVAGIFAIGLGVCTSNILTTTFRQQYCPPELLGRVTSCTAVVNYSMIPLGGVLAGALGSVLGVRETIWIMAGVQVLAVCILLASRLRPLRDFPSR
jgi:MFS family permease